MDSGTNSQQPGGRAFQSGAGGISVPAFTALGGGLPGAGLGGSENSLFGSNNLGDGQNSIAAPQFAELGGSLKQGGAGMLGAPLPTNPGVNESKRGRSGTQNTEDSEAQEKKDYSHLLQVFNIYKSKENFNASGFFNGGLDTGIEPSLLAVDFDTKENLADRLMTPFPTTSTVLPPSASLKDHEEYTKQLMHQTLQAPGSGGMMNGHAPPMQHSMPGVGMLAGSGSLSGAQPPMGNANYDDSFQVDIRIPQCYNMSKPKGLPESTIKAFPDTVLFYMFYNMPNDRAQLSAAKFLESKSWVYVTEEMRWVKMKPNNTFVRFNPEKWQEEPLYE